MNRRNFTKTLLTSFGLLLIPFKYVSAKSNKLPSLEKIIDYTFYEVRKELCGNNPFCNPELNRAVVDGRIKLISLGSSVEYWDENENLIPVEIKEQSVPVTWTVNDELRNDTLQELVKLAALLIENGIHSSEDQLLEKLGEGRLVISNLYSCYKTKTKHLSGYDAFYFTITTAYAQIPRK